MKAQFKPGYAEFETVLEIRPSREVCEKIHASLAKWIEDRFQKVMAGGICCPSMGEYTDDFAWADLDDGQVEMHVQEGIIRLIFLNEPEGDDRLDAAHPHWTEPHDHLWMLAVPRVKRLLEGKL